MSRSALRDYWTARPDAEKALRAWFKEAEQARWQSPAEVKEKYRSASFVGDNRVVFNIAGNKHRLVVHIHYDYGVIYVCCIGTHAEYDLIDIETV